MTQVPKCVLAVVDGMQPAALERAMKAGRAPLLSAIAERGTMVPEGAAAMFPSVTPVCATAIATGVRQDVHHVPAMNWYSRKARRYVEYGSSFGASRRFGIARQLNDTIYNMNGEHLNPEALTVFEQLDDIGVRTAGTTFLIYRGRHEHQLSRDTRLSRLAATVIRKPVMGPQELFYADLFASRETGCTATMGLPGARDQHTGCVGQYLLERDLCDFLLFSLPDNDSYSHRNGPDAQVDSIAEADRQLLRLAHAAGGIEAFLDAWGIVVLADHSHTQIERTIPIEAAIFDRFSVLGPAGRGAETADVALCPTQRAAQVYVLAADAAVRRRQTAAALEACFELDGVDLGVHRAADGDVVISRPGGAELRFAPGSSVRDPRGERWRIHGDLAVLGAHLEGDVLVTPDYPDALARCWAWAQCPTSGDLILSAAPTYEFPDWGGADHVGGGSHGSLHRCDSLGAFLFSGVATPPARAIDGAWSIIDALPMVTGHFAA